MTQILEYSLKAALLPNLCQHSNNPHCIPPLPHRVESVGKRSWCSKIAYVPPVSGLSGHRVHAPGGTNQGLYHKSTNHHRSPFWLPLQKVPKCYLLNDEPSTQWKAPQSLSSYHNCTSTLQHGQHWFSTCGGVTDDPMCCKIHLAFFHAYWTMCL